MPVHSYQRQHSGTYSLHVPQFQSAHLIGIFTIYRSETTLQITHRIVVFIINGHLEIILTRSRFRNDLDHPVPGRYAVSGDRRFVRLGYDPNGFYLVNDTGSSKKIDIRHLAIPQYQWPEFERHRMAKLDPPHPVSIGHTRRFKIARNIVIQIGRLLFLFDCHTFRLRTTRIDDRTVTTPIAVASACLAGGHSGRRGDTRR